MNETLEQQIKRLEFVIALTSLIKLGEMNTIALNG